MRVVDLFAGCGGLSKGFELANFEIILAIENWEPARSVYRLNFDHPVKSLDLNLVEDAVNIIQAMRPDLIMGGPPCQEFSAAGSRVEGPQAILTSRFAQIVSMVQPKWFVLENVPGLAKSSTWVAARKTLSDAGYGITESTMDAAYFGVPQHRKRFFVIGKLQEADGFLTTDLEHGKMSSPLSIRQFVGDEFGIDYYYRHPRTWGRKAIFSLDEPSPTIRSTNRPVSPGYKPHPNDAGPSSRARQLSILERARIQSFPIDFKLCGSVTDQNIMIANAVPVLLARHIASSINRYQERLFNIHEDNFREWLMLQRKYTNRTASNVISRLKRSYRILGFSHYSNDPLDLIHPLERKDEFRNLSASVRSQLRRAIRLQSEYFLYK